MNKLYYLLIVFLFLIFGATFFAIQNDYIIFRFPKKNITIELNNNLSTKKTIKIFYWNNTKWINENVDILISGKLDEDISKIINAWLNLLDEERIIEKISLQTALISDFSNELFLSFDRNIINEEHSTYQKLMLIESLLKTLRNNVISITPTNIDNTQELEKTGKISKINFLVHHKTMQDPHLDFSNPWPIEGYSVE